VAAPEFFFSIDLSDQADSREMLAEVVARVVAQAGPGANGLLKSVEAAIERSLPAGPHCCVTFLAHAGRLEVTVSTPAGQIWRATESLA
jgi:hypothetical protein